MLDCCVGLGPRCDVGLWKDSEAAARIALPLGDSEVGEPPGAVCEEVPMFAGALEDQVGSGADGERVGYVRRTAEEAALEAVFEVEAPMVAMMSEAVVRSRVPATVIFQL